MSTTTTALWLIFQTQRCEIRNREILNREINIESNYSLLKCHDYIIKIYDLFKKLYHTNNFQTKIEYIFEMEKLLRAYNICCDKLHISRDKQLEEKIENLKRSELIS